MYACHMLVDDMCVHYMHVLHMCVDHMYAHHMYMYQMCVHDPVQHRLTILCSCSVTDHANCTCTLSGVGKVRVKTFLISYITVIADGILPAKRHDKLHSMLRGLP